MAINLGALLRGATAARLGYAGGKRKAEDRTAELQLSARRTQALRAKEELERQSMTLEMAKLQRDLEHPAFRIESEEQYRRLHPAPEHNIDPLSAEGQAASLAKEKAERALGPKPSAGTGEKWKESTAINPKTGKPETVQINTETGAVRYLGITPASTRDAAATEGERKAQVLSSMSGDVWDVLDRAKPPGRATQAFARMGFNEALNAEEQKIRQAGMVLADAYIRLTSGANAPEQEVTRAFEMLTPRAGDTDAVLAQKRAFRYRVKSALEQAAGRANHATPTPVPVDSVGRKPNPLDG